MEQKLRPRITDLYEDRIVTRNERNEYGQWETVHKEFRYKKEINDLSTGLRFVNFFLDLIFYRILAYFYTEIPIVNESAILELVFIFSYPIYYILCEYYFQQTVGKLFTNSVVVDEFGEKPGFKTIVVRTAIRFIPFEAFSFLNQNRGWHDRWTKTFVIKKSELEKIQELMKDPENLEA